MTTRPTYLRTGQVARLFGLSPKTVSRYAKEGKLPFMRTLGGHRRFPEVEIRALVEANRVGVGEDATLAAIARRYGPQADRDLAAGRTVALDDVIDDLEAMERLGGPR